MALPLTLLPVECLELVSSIIGACGIAKLLQCGDGTLNRKLMNGGVRQLDLNWTSSAWIRWPSHLLQTFTQMTHFSIESTVPNRLCPSMDLKILPSNLRSLTIRADDVFILLERQNIHFADLLPSLAALELAGKRLTPYALHNLPKTITSLHIADPDAWLPTSDFLGGLPTGMLSLQLYFTFMHENQDGRFPPELERLHFSAELASSSPLDLIKTLPHSLRELHMDLSLYHDGHLQLFGDMSTLPPHLTILEARGGLGFPYPELGRLPPSLTHLATYFEGNLQDDYIANLPRGLRRLKDAYGLLTEDCFKNLPRTIEVFPQRITLTTASTRLADFAPNLKTLWIGEEPFNGATVGIGFPPTLTSLELPWLNDAICCILPGTLRRLTARNGEVTESGVAMIPKRLERLDLDLAALQNDRTLEHLGHISELCWSLLSEREPGITDKFLESLVVVENGWSELTFAASGLYADMLTCSSFTSSLGRLRNLSKLVLSLYELKEGSMDAFDNLPETLRELDIGTLPSVPTSDNLITLPRKLHILGLRWKSSLICHWDRQALLSLPRSIYKLTLGSVPHGIPGHIAQAALPPYLSQINIPWSNWESVSDPMAARYGPDASDDAW